MSIWLEDATSVKSRLDIMEKYKLAGVAYWRLVRKQTAYGIQFIRISNRMFSQTNLNKDEKDNRKSFIKK